MIFTLAPQILSLIAFTSVATGSASCPKPLFAYEKPSPVQQRAEGTLQTKLETALAQRGTLVAARSATLTSVDSEVKNDRGFLMRRTLIKVTIIIAFDPAKPEKPVKGVSISGLYMWNDAMSSRLQDSSGASYLDLEDIESLLVASKSLTEATDLLNKPIEVDGAKLPLENSLSYISFGTLSLKRQLSQYKVGDEALKTNDVYLLGFGTNTMPLTTEELQKLVETLRMAVKALKSN